MGVEQTRIRSFPVERVHGSLLAPRLRFEALRKWATWIGLVAYLGVMVALYPREFWIDVHRVSPKPTIAALILLLVPTLVVLALSAKWQFSSESMMGRHGAPSLELVGDELSVEIDGSEQRRVSLVGASLDVGVWRSRGHVTGPLLVISQSGDRLRIGARAAGLASDGEQGTPDVELSEDQYRELAQELGVS